MSRAARGRRAIPNGCRLHRSPNCERHATSAPAGWLRWCRAAGRSPPTGIHQGEHVVIGDARVSHGNEATIALLQAGGAAHRRDVQTIDRKSVVEGKSVSVRVDRGGGRIIKKKKNKIQT